MRVARGKTAYHGIGKSGSGMLSYENEDKKPGGGKPENGLQYQDIALSDPMGVARELRLERHDGHK
jgi:hypothetical protein